MKINVFSITVNILLLQIIIRYQLLVNKIKLIHTYVRTE